MFIEFYEVLSGFHFSDQDSGWDRKGHSKGQKKENAWQVENISMYLLKPVSPYQDITFSTRIQDGIPSGNQSCKTIIISDK